MNLIHENRDKKRLLRSLKKNVRLMVFYKEKNLYRKDAKDEKPNGFDIFHRWTYEGPSKNNFIDKRLIQKCEKTLMNKKLIVRR